jgi:hypothetical protein
MERVFAHERWMRLISAVGWLCAALGWAGVALLAHSWPAAGVAGACLMGALAWVERLPRYPRKDPSQF